MTKDQTETSGEEQFEIFTEGGEPVGTAPRSRVHAEGLWHKSAQVFLFDSQGRLYLQRRVDSKDVCPGLWDQSAAEHLTPGESYLDGALRGLAEELGLPRVHLTPLGEPFAGRLDQDALGVHDYELQQAFIGTWDGPMRIDPEEVAEVRAVPTDELVSWISRSPEDFTPWFLRDVVRCGILPSTPTDPGGAPAEG
ncbi:MAG: NUDIX domain-containing protein [Gammaproteobacteria bacterium]|nr:MAG: NUDIX domain-containing protein [Gammaproteobacteria bacterium]